MTISTKGLHKLGGILFFIVLFFTANCADAAQSVIRILHVNDFHGFAEPHKTLGSDEKLGGIAYLSSEVDRLRTETPSLLLAAGDMISGNNWANLFEGRSAIEVMNAMHFDAMVVGNHEFDYGENILRGRVSEAAFPVLGANVLGFKGVLKPYIIKNIGGVRIAVIGLVTDDTPVTTSPKNVEGLSFLSPAETLKKYMGELREKADIVVVLSHIGYAKDRQLAREVRGIDVIVGGHSHTKLSKPDLVGGTIIVQAWEHAKALGVLDLTIDQGRVIAYNGHLDEISPAPLKPDQKVEKIVEGYEKRADALMGKQIGFADSDLDGEHVRSEETNLGDLIADIIRETSGSEAALINGGSIRTGIAKGVITKGEVYSTVPFDNYIVAIKLTGEQIREALEHGVSAVEQKEGRFPQVSGIIFSYSGSAPAGHRIRNVSIAGRPLDPKREYIVATNDFLAAGGDGYRAFGDAVRSSKDFSIIGGAMKGQKLVYSNAGKWLRDVVIGYIKNKKHVAPKVEGRIKELP